MAKGQWSSEYTIVTVFRWCVLLFWEYLWGNNYNGKKYWGFVFKRKAYIWGFCPVLQILFITFADCEINWSLFCSQALKRHCLSNKKTGKLLPEALSYSDMPFINIKPDLVGLQAQAFAESFQIATLPNSWIGFL